MTAAMIGKVSIASSYQVIYLFSTELIPTEVRQYGLGSCNVMARMGSILSPYITDLLVNNVLLYIMSSKLESMLIVFSFYLH